MQLDHGKNGRFIAKHGLSKAGLYNIWRLMLQRCYDPRYHSYKNYGGRGITVCDEWRFQPNTFLRDMGPTYKKGLTLERRDNHSGYCKENCSWETRITQGRNKRNNKTVDTPNGKMLVCEAEEISGIYRKTLMWRINNDWPVERLFDPVGAGRHEAPEEIATPILSIGLLEQSIKYLPELGDKISAVFNNESRLGVVVGLHENLAWIRWLTGAYGTMQIGLLEKIK